jgi:hypothetical protein
VSIPSKIEDRERIVRVLYFPKNVKNDKALRANAFRTPPDKDEVSIIRVDYCSAKFCKEHGKKYEDPDQKRKYFGLAVLTVKEIRGVDADVVHSPLPGNPAHGDIKIGFCPPKGEQLPAEYQYKVDEMVRMSRVHEDKDPDNDEWTGEELV